MKQPSRPQHRKLDDSHELLIIGIILANPCVYLREMCSKIREATGVVVSGTTVCRVLKSNGITRKKVQHVAKQRCMEYRAQFRRFFVWVDESGSDAHKWMRKFGYSLRGLPPVCHRFMAHGKRISAIAAICSDGLLGVELTTGSVNGEMFVDFVIPSINSFDGTSNRSIVVMDNCSIHHIPEVILRKLEYLSCFCHHIVLT